jgi:hypothetical protein
MVKANPLVALQGLPSDHEHSSDSDVDVEMGHSSEEKQLAEENQGEGNLFVLEMLHKETTCKKWFEAFHPQVNRANGKTFVAFKDLADALAALSVCVRKRLTYTKLWTKEDERNYKFLNPVVKDQV